MIYNESKAGEGRLNWSMVKSVYALLMFLLVCTCIVLPAWLGDATVRTKLMGALLAGATLTGLLNIPYAVIIKPVKKQTENAKINQRFGVLWYDDRLV